jgi:hypothetical protein
MAQGTAFMGRFKVTAWDEALRWLSGAQAVTRWPRAFSPA